MRQESQIVVKDTLLGRISIKLDEYGNIILERDKVNEGALIKAFEEHLPGYSYTDEIVRVLRLLNETFDDLEYGVGL